MALSLGVWKKLEELIGVSLVFGRIFSLSGLTSFTEGSTFLGSGELASLFFYKPPDFDTELLSFIN